MDFTLIEKTQRDKTCYKLLKTNFYRNYYVFIVQNDSDFCCCSVFAQREEAHLLFEEIVGTNTEPHTLADIVADRQKQLI